MEEKFKESYDSLNKYHHYLILHLDGLHDDLIKKNFNYLIDKFKIFRDEVPQNPEDNLKIPKLVMIKDGKHTFFNSYTDEDKKVLDDYVTFNDDYIIIKNPSYVYECFNICSGIFKILKPHNKAVDVIRHVDILKHGTKNIFRIFAGKTHYLDINNHKETFEVSFGGEEYIIIRTGFTSKIDKKKLESYLERYKFLPYFLYLRDGDTIIKNEDIFTVDSSRKIEEIEVKELMESLEDFTKAKINDGFIVFANDYGFKTSMYFLHMLKEFNYCSLKGIEDISRISKLEFGDYKQALYLRLDCQEI